MAIRRHLILAPVEGRDRLGAAIGTVPGIAGGWCWAAASAWAISRDELLERLGAGPVAVFSTFDGDGWDLAVADSAGTVSRATHVFAKDWRDGDAGARARVRLMASLLLSVAPTAEASALEEVLAGQALNPAEVESDLGDLPRLLQALGAAGILEIPEPPPPKKARPARARLLAPLTKGHEERPRGEVSGVSLPVPHAADLAALALFCEPDAHVLLLARGEDLPLVQLDIPGNVARHKGALVVEADGGIGLKLNVVERAIAQLAGCPGLGELTLLTGARGAAGKRLAWHRYAGPVEGGRWSVREATPPVAAGTLAHALSLIALRRGNGPIACASSEEARAIAARCADSLYLTPAKLPKVAGDSLEPADGTRVYVLLELFRARFGAGDGPWSAEAPRAREKAELVAWKRLEGAPGPAGPGPRRKS